MKQEDKSLLRELAKKYMEKAHDPVMDEKVNLWKALNRGKMVRPMVLIDQLPWNELNIGDELVCAVEEPYWRGVEWRMRTDLFKLKYFPVDYVIDQFITLPKTFLYDTNGMKRQEHILASDKTNAVVSRKFDNQFEEYEDLEKIQKPKVEYFEKVSLEHYEQGLELFDGVAPVRLGGIMNFHLGVWDTITNFMGVENIYYEMADRPEFLLAIAEKMTASILEAIDLVNELKLAGDHSNLCHCSHIYTDELLPEGGASRGADTKNCWAFGLAQLFTAASPELFEELEFPFVSKMAEKFGMIYYGCCDRLDDRLDIVKKIPNLKKVSCSPWSDRKAFAEKIGTEIVMSNKPTPTFMGTSHFDEAAIRKDLTLTRDLARENNVNLEFILKDISTVLYEPERLTKWADIAMEVVNS